MEVKFNTPGWRDVALLLILASSFVFNIHFVRRLKRIEEANFSDSCKILKCWNFVMRQELKPEPHATAIDRLDWTAYYLRKRMGVTFSDDSFFDEFDKLGGYDYNPPASDE